METIKDFIQHEPFFETHNHQGGYKAYDWSAINYREFVGYAHADMAVAAGIDNCSELTDEKFFQLWQFVRTTGYGEAVELGVRRLFDLDYTLENVDAINRQLRQFTGRQTVAEVYVKLFSLSNIVGSVNDIIPVNSLTTAPRMNNQEFPDFFRFAIRPDDMQGISKAAFIHELEATLDCSITKLADFEYAIGKLIDCGNAAGKLRALKIGLAYDQVLDFPIPSLTSAQKAFSTLMSGKTGDLKPFHDHVFHCCLRAALARNLVVQIHTGYLAGYNKDLRRGNPEPLIPIFIKYPDLRFDLFHAGWPWSELMGAIGKQFPNVWLDLCWAWTMNPIQMERTLSEWLAAVPSNKILGYGSDALSPFEVIGYAQQARNGIAKVFAKKISTGEFSKATAEFIARRIMHENARDLYQ